MTERDVTDYLRGIAITAIVPLHYLLYYKTGFYYRYFFDYGNEIVAFFFIVSGYGIYRSLEKRFSLNGSVRSPLWRYFYDRFFRIYPLYWLGLAVSFAIPPASYLDLVSLGWKTPTILLGNSYWFVASILQCYIASPLLFFLIRKFKVHYYLLINLLAFAVLLWASLWLKANSLTENYYINPLIYRHFLLFNVLLFSLGMAIPSLISGYGNKVGNKAWILAALLVLGVSAYYVRGQNGLFANSEIILNFPFLLSALMLSLLLILNKPKLPWKRSIGFFGRNSYSIYLLHEPLFGLLAFLGIITLGSRKSMIYALVIFIPFLFVCSRLEGINKSIHEKVTSMFANKDRGQELVGAVPASSDS